MSKLIGNSTLLTSYNYKKWIAPWLFTILAAVNTNTTLLLSVSFTPMLVDCTLVCNILSHVGNSWPSSWCVFIFYITVQQQINMLNLFSIFSNMLNFSEYLQNLLFEFFQHVLFDKNSLLIVLPSIQHLFQNLVYMSVLGR